MVFTIEGIDIPLAYTIGAKRDLLAEFGSADKLAAVFATESDVVLAENAAKVGAIMANAEFLRQKSKNALLGTEITAKVIGWEELFSLLEGDAVLDLINAISQTIKEANKTSIEVKPEKKDEAKR